MMGVVIVHPEIEAKSILVDGSVGLDRGRNNAV